MQCKRTGLEAQNFDLGRRCATAGPTSLCNPRNSTCQCPPVYGIRQPDAVFLNDLVIQQGNVMWPPSVFFQHTNGNLQIKVMPTFPDNCFQPLSSSCELWSAVLTLASRFLTFQHRCVMSTGSFDSLILQIPRSSFGARTLFPDRLELLND